jgi:sugar lactone lactonase YvrE
MAGHHQIWVMDLAKATVSRYAGSGAENIKDGGLADACFAQPSGLASDGGTLYVADSEVSAIRAVPLDDAGDVRTIVGEGLFEFGDVDGVGTQARLQHALGVAFFDGRLYIADTYNSKIKVLNPARQELTTFLGGKQSGWLTEPSLNEPGGLSIAGDKLYIADTNNHRVRVVNLRTRAISTLKLQDVQAPASVASAARSDSATPGKP